MNIYLAGYIQGSCLNKCISWRKRIREFYNNYKGKPYPIEWLDPLNGKDFESITPDGLKSSCDPQAIVHRDHKCVDMSDLIIANLDTFGEDRPLIGTLCELAWAWEKHIPIVLITTEKQYTEHPFLRYFASWIVSDVDELLDKKIVNYFFKGWVSAEY